MKVLFSINQNEQIKKITPMDSHKPNYFKFFVPLYILIRFKINETIVNQKREEEQEEQI